MTKKKKVFLISCLSLLNVLATTFSSVTLAKFIEIKRTDQSAYGGGERQVSIFFNANIWDQGKDGAGNPVDSVYYMYVWHSSNSGREATLIPSAHVKPKVSGTQMDLYVFEFDSTKLDRFLFLRWDPSIAPSTDLAYGNGTWNKTLDQTYSSTYNYYCIDGWGTNDEHGHAVADPTRNYILKQSNGTLVWTNPE